MLIKSKLSVGRLVRRLSGKRGSSGKGGGRGQKGEGEQPTPTRHVFLSVCLSVCLSVWAMTNGQCTFEEITRAGGASKDDWRKIMGL